MNGGELAKTLVYNPFQIAAYLAELDRQQREKRVNVSLGEPSGAGHGYIRLHTSCGKNRRVRELCSNPLCTKCEPVRAFRRRRRWFKVLQAMREPRMITLTIPDGLDLAERILFLNQSFRRLLHMRLGHRNQVRLFERSLCFAEAHFKTLVEKQELTTVEVEQRLKDLRLSLDRFLRGLRPDQDGKWPRLRHVVGTGFASLEITFSTDWHVHRHLCVDGRFIPWALLCAAWQVATRGEAKITDIRKLDKSTDGMSEVAKYLTKPWDIPEVKQAEFIQAVSGKKRIWPLGGAKPEETKQVCPYCNNPDCEAKVSGLDNLIEVGSLWGYAYRIFEADELTDRSRKRYLEIRRPDGMWDEVPLLDTLNVCAPVGARAGPGGCDKEYG